MLKLFSKILLVCFGTIASLLAAELFLRMASYEGARERFSSTFDTNFGHIPKESWIYRFPDKPTESSDAEVNGQRIPFKKDPEKLRALFVGDSGTFGSGVNFEETFPFVFASSAEKLSSAAKFESINSGIPGMSTVDELALFEQKLFKLKPDLVVLGLFMANDINFNLRFPEKRLSKKNMSVTTQLLAYLRQHSALFHFISLRLLVLNYKYGLVTASSPKDGYEPAWTGALDSNGLPLLSYMHGEIATYQKKYSELMNYSFEVLESSLQNFDSLSKGLGFDFLVVLIPTSSSISNKLDMFYWPDALEILKKDGIVITESELDIGKPTRLVMEICNRNKIKCLDPTTLLRDKLGMQTINPNDDHLSAASHQLVGEFIAKSVVSRE